MEKAKNRYRLTSTRNNSSKYGNCEICNKPVSEVYQQVKQKRFFFESKEHWTHESNTFGHKSCLEFIQVDSGDWICTDPDNDQFRLDEGQNLWKNTAYLFRQGTTKEYVDLKDYSHDKIRSIINSYGYDTIDFTNYFIQGTDQKISLDVIAECIFETEILGS